VAFDGLGLGTDGTIWGGELLLVDGPVFKRVGHLRQIPLLGGDKANEEPARMALSLISTLVPEALEEALWLAEHFGEPVFKTLVEMLEKQLNSPLTSSAGRLFDAFASIAGLCQKMDYEGQAAMLLEGAFDHQSDRAYPFYPVPDEQGWMVIDPSDATREALLDVMMGEEPSAVATGFHRGLANGVVCACAELMEDLGLDRVALSGGCFQNRVFTDLVSDGLESVGAKVFRQRLVPPGDGGVSLGQAWIASLSFTGGPAEV
jgi:hydrogenase maturation protein HypF